MSNGKVKYEVRPGMRFGRNKQFGPGDVILLTREEAGPFMDKLMLAPDRRAKINERVIEVPAVAETQAVLADYLSPETVKLLERAGYGDFDQLRGLSWRDIVSIRGIGPARAKEIVELQKIMESADEEE